jgi:hypothetical protein
MGVYTRNRAFRLYLSSKWGKKGAEFVLEPSPANAFPVDLSTWSGERAVLLDSLVCPTYAGRASAHGDRESAGARLLAVDGASADAPTPAGAPGRAVGPNAAGGNSKFAVVGTASPFPSLDAFLRAHLAARFPARPGRVRQATYLPPRPCEALDRGGRGRAPPPGRTRSGGGGTVVFEIRGNRFCGNVGRWHRSNHVFYVASLPRRERVQTPEERDPGKPLGWLYQKCHDPDCRGFRSEGVALPARVAEDIVAALADCGGSAEDSDGGEEWWERDDPEGDAAALEALEAAEDDMAALEALEAAERSMEAGRARS